MPDILRLKFKGIQQEKKTMAMDIFVGIMCVIAVGAGIWVWWMENGGTDQE